MIYLRSISLKPGPADRNTTFRSEAIDSDKYFESYDSKKTANLSLQPTPLS